MDLTLDQKIEILEAQLRRSERQAEVLGNMLKEAVKEYENSMEELRKAKIQADGASRAKSDFLANMSHEIRTPMNGVMGMLDILKQTTLDTQQQEYVGLISQSAENLLLIINDILDFSKIEAGMLELESIDFNLRNTIEETAQLMAPKAHEKGIELVHWLTSDVPSLLKGDPGRLRQVISNLISNAIKFTEVGEVVLSVELSAEKEDRVELHFRVRDTGIGIPEHRLDRLFRSFSQVDASTTRRFGGTGLGLAICKSLIERMEGRIGVESREGKGSTFWFRVPLRRQHCSVESPATPPVAILGKRILVVDDNRTNRKILSSYLKNWGCRHSEAESGQTALTLLHQAVKDADPYDLVIIDYMMPEMDGAQLGTAIKATPTLQEIPMVMLTSCGMRGDAAHMQQIGFDGYLTKPIREQLLYDCLIAVLTMASQNDAMPNLPSCPRKSSVTAHSLRDARYQNVRILLVEDNIINQKVATKILEKFGFKSDLASNGFEAIQMLASTRYDLVLMDVQMPVMDGYEATAHIRNHSSNVRPHDIPIIAMTANAMKGDEEKCLQAGMNDYLSKPIDSQKLLTKLKQWLRLD
jgi:two-component system sensor histidine kinase/response regulator